uniref:Uncharacterized protein n=1 Tax=Anguilla anguilla TaxID=7936 RepID=A0A0E9PVB2_ANGAN
MTSQNLSIMVPALCSHILLHPLSLGNFPHDFAVVVCNLLIIQHTHSSEL